MIKETKQVIVYGLLIVVVAGGVWFLKNYLFQPETKIFLGTVARIQDNTITVVGLPNVNNATSNYESGKTVTVMINSETTIIKEDGPYELRVDKNSQKPPSREDVTRQRTQMTLAQLQADAVGRLIFLKVVADKNIYNKDKFTAVTIYYSFDGFKFSGQ